MKIFCVGMNYRPHCIELNNPIPQEPVLFFKPDSAYATDKNPFFLPDFSQEIHYETELVVKISKLGKNIAEKFAHRYYEEFTLGLDMTARDIQNEARSKGLPWTTSKGFDQSAIVGKFLAKDCFNLQALHFHLDINGERRQEGFTGDMIFSIDQLVSYASRFFTLKTGDLIFTGTPMGVGPVAINDTLEAYVGERKLLEVRIK